MYNYQKCDVFFSPSFWAHTSTGFLILIILFIFIKNYNQIINLNIYNILILLLLFTIVIGIHGLSHIGLESIYGFNPINNY